MSTVIGVERPEHMIAELLGVAGGKKSSIDVYKFLARKSTRGTIHLETLVPFPDRLFIIFGVRLEEIDVLITKFADLCLLTTHRVQLASFVCLYSNQC